MCLESGERSRRRHHRVPMLCLTDSSASLSSSSHPEPAAMPFMPARNCRPEIFTFDVEAVQAAPAKPTRRGTLGPRGKRPRRVLYPAKVRKYLPPPETDRPLRWLYILCLLVFVQICCEEGMPDEQLMPTMVTMVTMDDINILQPPVNVLPPDTLTGNHSQEATFNDTSLASLLYQR